MNYPVNISTKLAKLKAKKEKLLKQLAIIDENIAKLENA